jgi:hypothetical protein
MHGTFKVEAPVTIAIGLLCDQGKSILLCSDKLVSYGDIGSNQGGSKIYDLPLGLYAAVADDVSCSHVVISEMCENLSKLDSNDPAITDKTKLALAEAGNYAFRWMRGEVLKEIGLTDEEFLHDSSLSKQRGEEAVAALQEAKQKGLPIEIIVAGFVSGRPIFFYTDGLKIVEQTSPGIFVAGSGSDAATHWLNYREQNTFISRHRSFYHLVEAMMFARMSPHVGTMGTTLLLCPNTPMVRLETVQDSKEFKLIDRWWKACWPKNTAALDIADIQAEFENTFAISSS